MSENATTASPLGAPLKHARELIKARAFGVALELLARARKEKLEEAPVAEQEELLYCMGVCCGALGRAPEASANLKRALELAEQSQDASAQARDLEELGSAHHQQGEFREAEQCFGRALELYRELDYRPGVARNLRNLGGTHLDMGLLGKAAEDYEQARQLFADEQDGEGTATCVVNMAQLVLHNRGRKATIDEYERHLQQCDCAHFVIFNNLAFLQLLEDRLDDARDNLLRGFEDCRKRGVRDDNLGLLHLNLGILDALSANYAEADEHFRQASQVFIDHPGGRAVEVVLLPETAHRDHGMPRFFTTENGHRLAVAFLNTAMVAHMRGDEELALKLAGQAVDFDQRQGYPYAALGWLQQACGQDAEAAASLRTACGKEPGNEFFKQSLELVNPYRKAGVGRNDPCPCGSGKKYKKCHGAS